MALGSERAPVLGHRSSAILQAKIAMNYTNPKDKNKSENSNANSIELDSLPTIEFDEYLWDLANGIADLRDRTYTSIDGGQIFGDQPSRDAHLVGVLGELAVAEFLDGLIPEDITVLEKYGDRGWNLTVGSSRVDVKSTATDLTVPDLIVPQQPKPVAEGFILTHRVGEREVRLLGYASRSQVLGKSPQRHPGDSMNYIVPAHELALFQKDE